MGTQKLSLKWKNHHSNFVAVFDQLLSTEKLVDVTIACEGMSLKAHKIVLSSCSNFFKDLFFDNPCKHPIVVLKDICYADLKAVVEFMYHGKVDVPQDRWSLFLHTAETLRVKGLTEVANELGGQSIGNKRKEKEAVKKITVDQASTTCQNEKQSIFQVVPVSLQHAEPSRNWQDHAETSSLDEKGTCTSEDKYLSGGIWKNCSQSSQKLQNSDAGGNSHTLSPTSSEDSSSCSSENDGSKDNGSESVRFFSPHQQPSNNITFFTAPVATLQSAMEEDSAAPEMEEVYNQLHITEISESNSEERSVNSTPVPTILKVSRAPGFHMPTEDYYNDDDFILPTPTKFVSENIVGKKTSASNMLSALARKAITSSLFENSGDKGRFETNSIISSAFSNKRPEQQSNSNVFSKQVKHTMPVLKPVFPKYVVNVTHSKKRDSFQAQRISRHKSNEFAAKRKKTASQILGKSHDCVDIVTEMDSNQSTVEDCIKDESVSVTNVSVGKSGVNYSQHISERTGNHETSANNTPVLDVHLEKDDDENDGSQEELDALVDSSDEIKKESLVTNVFHKEGKRERRPPKKLDSYVVGTTIPAFDDYVMKYRPPPKPATPTKRKPALKPQISPKKVEAIEPLFAERGEEIHVGNDIWIEQNGWTIANRAETDRQFCNTLASCIWGNSVLVERGITGKSLVGNTPKRPLSPHKINLIKDRLTERLVKKNIVEEDISHRVKQVHKYLSDHILSLSRRRYRAFMKQRQQQSS